MAIEPGTKLGRYEIRSTVGEGGMGKVYLAQDTKLNRKVALKVLPPELASHRDRMERFVREAKAAAALNHPKIATIHGLGVLLRSRNTAAAIESIGVLPFENRSNDADTEYLSDGLTESLIYRLSQLPNLKVSPTSSVMRYKGKAMDMKTIPGELGVSAVLAGRIAQRGESLTISVELVDVRNNKLLWG